MTSKTLIKLSFGGLVGRVVRRYCCALRGWIEGKVIENEGWDWTSFLGQRRLCSHVTKNDVKWSDNALTKPVMRARLLSTEKRKKISTYNHQRQHALGRVGFFFPFFFPFSVRWKCTLRKLSKYDIVYQPHCTNYCQHNGCRVLSACVLTDLPHISPII